MRTQLFFCGEAGPRAPRCPLKLTEQAGPNVSESDAVASPWGDLGIHNSGPPTVKHIIQAIDIQMQTTHNQSRSHPAPTAPPVRTGA